MNRVRIGLVAAALSFQPVVATGQSPSDFALRQTLATSGDKAFFRIELPDAVYDGAARADLLTSPRFRLHMGDF